ncbi:MAG TPA: AAA family ATPase [Armatimonadota bacterium]|nr:AAA family ATPase [Planctomycetota bacterium]HUV04650.1 AAA family ATPase [Armatimonadota bacterium]
MAKKPSISRLSIEGFKSIRKQEIELRPINVLIGANGSGKSNLLSFFRLLSQMARGNFQLYIAKQGGADVHLHFGSKSTRRIEAAIELRDGSYKLALEPTAQDNLAIAEEVLLPASGVMEGELHRESLLRMALDQPWSHSEELRAFAEDVSRWVVYHINDTSESARITKMIPVNDNEYLRGDGENLAAYLYRLTKESDETRVCYAKLRDVLRLVVPFFDDFRLQPMSENPNRIQLQWKQKDSDYPFFGFQLSDGVLRFICLATALLQPNPPSVILIDEPELGLHPYALELLAALIKGASFDSQVVVSTQSGWLLDCFEPEDALLVERENGESSFRRLNSASLSGWLEDYTLGELWWKNVLSTTQ